MVSSTAGPFIFQSLRALLRGPAHDVMTDWRVLVTVGHELVIALCWVALLKRRGWTLRHVTHRAALGDVGAGAALAVYTVLAYWLLFVGVATASPALARAVNTYHMTGSVSLWAVLLLSAANPVFEEFLYLGFVANVLRGKGPVLAVSASVLVRILVHLYQGPIAILTNVPFGATLTVYYLQSRRIWPPVVAHSLVDLLALSRFVG